MEEENLEEKTENPTQQRIDKFREKGDVAQSKDLQSLMILSVSFALFFVSFSYLLESISSFFSWALSVDFQQIYAKEGYSLVLNKIGKLFLEILIPFCLMLLIFGIGSSLIQFGLIFSPEILSLNFERLDPIKGISRIFNKKMIVEGFKNFFKILFIFGVLYFCFKENLSFFFRFFESSPLESMAIGKEFLQILLGLILLSFALIAGLDFIYQRFIYQQKIKMTKEELKRETKEQEGNPEIKQRIKKIQREIARRKMMSEVKKADVIVTNPTHYSIAIKYDKQKMLAPKILAKGKDLIALRIREIAKEFNIPLVENKPLARKLYQEVKVGGIIPQDLYKAVAEVLAFVYKLKRKL